MSRIGRKPIPIPQGVKVQVGDGIVRAEGPKGKLSQPIPSPLSVKLDDGVLVIGRPDDERKIRALHGLTRALMANMVSGVKDGFERKLEIVGIGYRAQMQGKAIQFALGYSHPVIFPLPDGITAEIDKQVAANAGKKDELIYRLEQGTTMLTAAMADPSAVPDIRPPAAPAKKGEVAAAPLPAKLQLLSNGADP